MGSPARTTSRTGSKSGFTLIEIVLVAVTLIVLLGASVPRFQQTIQRLRVERGAFELMQLLRLAHARAVTGSREVRWVWDEQARRARVEPQDEAAAGERAVESAPLVEGVEVAVLQDDAPVSCRCVKFFPEGTSEPVVLTLGFRAWRYTLTVDETTGSVSLTTGAVAR